MFFISPPFGNYLQLDRAISIKGSYTLTPRDGLLLQILRTLRYFPKYSGWVNKIGLRNRGIDKAIIDFHRDMKNSPKKKIIYSIAIMKPDEIIPLIDKIPKNMDLEINISCPNVQKHEDLQSCKDLQKFLDPRRNWCIIKLSPLCSTDTIDQYYRMGFRQFHCCNTLPVAEGGLSGKIIQPFSEKLIHYIRTTYGDSCEIVAGGGIHTTYDVEHFRKVGANHFAFSTLCFNPWKFSSFYRKYLW